MEIPPLFHLHRTDPLTGCSNLLGFLDWLVRHSGRRCPSAHSLIALDVNDFAELNAAHIETAGITGQPLAMLLIDGDNLRRYNALGGYAAGDQMIRDLSATLHGQLRPGDFLARWRVGDEFLVLLPDTSLPSALTVGDRLCCAVREASQKWLMPISLAHGAAAYPQHGVQQAELLAQAEAAKDQAKAQGKDRVIAARL